MQSHRVLWNVSLSNGENFREGSGPFVEVEGGDSPWNQLLAYLHDEVGAHITAIWLTCPGGARHVLPSLGIKHKPLLHAFHSAEPPISLRCFHRQASDPTKPGEAKDLYTVAEATFKDYRLQIFVSEHDPNVSWSLVIPDEDTVATG